MTQTDKMGATVWYVAAGYKLPAGIEAYLLHYATEMRLHGFDPRIVVFYPLPAEKHRYLSELEERNIPIESLYTRVAVLAWLCISVALIPWLLYIVIVRRLKPNLVRFRSWLFNLCAVRELGRMIQNEDPDIIHVKGRLSTGAWSVFPSDRTIYHHALMGTVDSSWTDSELADFRVFANRVARIFAPGERVAETLSREYGIERKVHAIFAMAPDEWGGAYKRVPANGGMRFGILCRLVEQKGIHDILAALSMFKEKHGDISFLFAGIGDLADHIREHAANHGIKGVRVESVETPTQTLSKIDVFVHPGLDDAMPVSIVEALMFGIPCITTDVGGCPDLVRDGVEGIIVRPRCPGMLLDAMERFSGMDPDEYKAFQCRARSRYESVCTPSSVGKIVEDHYRSIMRDRGRGDQQKVAASPRQAWRTGETEA